MGLSRLDNFLKNTKGEILYVDPSSLDSTDSIENQGNSLARPFKTIQRALIEAARFSYQAGRDNDRFGKTTILLYPGEHIIDNRPGYVTTDVSGQYYQRNGSLTNDLSPFDTTTNFNVLAENNALYKLNSIYGGVIVPRGTSIVGLDLRKTKIRPRYVPNPSNDQIERSAIFRVTGACYFWQFTVLDADGNAICYKDYTTNTFVPNFSHHKLTVFEYADGKNFVDINDDFLEYFTQKTDLDMYYQKIGDVYGSTSGREIEPESVDVPLDIESKVDEYRIVGSRGAEVGISSIRAGDGSASSNVITVNLVEALDGIDVDTPIQISGVSVNGYTGQFVVSEKISDTEIQYQTASAPIVALPNASEIAEASLSIVTDTVTSASPYIFNCSLRSVYGMCGMHADGDKVEGFKSMVVAQFTGIGLQKDNNAFIKYNSSSGTYEDTTTVANLYSNSLSRYKPDYENFHIKASNNAFIQIVSVFAIGYANHFVSESGGDLSITNSNSNFGARSLVAKGFQSESFVKDDCGYITHVIPPRENVSDEINLEFNSIDVNATTGIGTTSALYLYGAQIEQSPPNSVIEGYRLGAKQDDTINIDIIAGGETTQYYARVVMPGTETSYEKSFTVAKKSNGISNEITANVITLIGNHTFENGETIRILSDTGHIPDGIVPNQVYYAITDGLAANEVQIAKTLNDALIGQEATIYSNETSTVKIVSRVSDKNSGDIGHPIQWDSYNNQWYINVSNSDNTIYPLLSSLSSAATPRSYFVRTPDNRPLSDRIYRLRYVIPKDNPFTARPPIEGYVLQESGDATGTTDENSKYFSIASKTLSNSAELRNPRFIANATWNGTNTITFTTELAHNLNVGTYVEVRNVLSTLNDDAEMDVGYNGYYLVTTIPSSKTFTVTETVDPGTFTNDVSTRNEDLPYFTKFELDGTYTIYRSDEIQKYIKDEQDGIYHLIVTNSSNTPIVSPFSSQKYSQPIQNLYPQINRDNPNSDPDATVCFAKSDPIGEVIVNDPQNSITKETITKVFGDVNLGIGITDIVSTPSSGIAHTIFTVVDHGLNRIQKLSIVDPGAGYGSGAGSLIYNATLVGTSASVTGDHATVVVSIDGSGSLTGVKILDGGTGYSVGDQLYVTGTATTTGFTTATLQVTSTYNNIGDTLFVTGVSNLYDEYNGLYTISGVSTLSTRQIFVESVENISGINTTGIGITVLTSAEAYVLGPRIGISSLSYNNVTGIASLTSLTSHGFQQDQKIKIVGANYSGYNQDWLVNRSTSLTSFEINVGIGTTIPNALGTIYALRNGFNSRGGLVTPQDENISSRLIENYDNLTTTLSAAVASADSTNISVNNVTILDLELGDYLQIGDEIVRIRESVDGNPIEVFRGSLGSKRSSHLVGTVVRRIKPIPVEFRRNSIIRASGHTFEYLGYGPGNYSTGFPDRQDRVLGTKETLLSQSNKQDGGVIAFTAMDSDGNFFIGNKKLNSTTGREEVFDAPIVTVTGEDFTSGDTAGIDIQTSSEIIATRSLKVEGGPDGNIITEFNGPVIFNNKITSSSSDGIEVESLYLQGDSKISRKYTTGTTKPTYEGNSGDVVYNSTPDTGGTLGWVYTSDSTWQDFGLISNDTPLSRNLGITTYGGYLGIATNLNLIGLGVSIYGDVDETSGIGTLTFFSSSVEPQYLYVAGVSTFLNKVDLNNQVFFNAGLIATTGVSTFNDGVKLLDGVDIFNGATVDTLTVSESIITTEINTTTFTNTSSNFAGNISAGTTGSATNTTIKSLSGDNNNAGFEAHGDTQGTGYLFVGSRSARGGGISFNGNLSPAFALSESADTVSFFRRGSSVNTVVFSYPYNSDDVTFNGNIFAEDVTISGLVVSNNASITGSISTVANINSIGVSTLPTIKSDDLTVNSSADILGPVTQNVVALGATTVVDCSQGNYFTCTVNSNVTFSFTNVPSSRAFGVTVEITHTSGSISWPSEVKFPEDQAPLLTTGKTHLFMFVTDDGGTRWRGAALFDYVD